MQVCPIQTEDNKRLLIYIYYTFEKKKPKQQNPYFFFYSIAYCSIAVVGIVGNSAVYIVVRKSPQMRSLTNQLIANLAVADLLVNILCVPFTLVSNLNPGR